MLAVGVICFVLSVAIHASLEEGNLLDSRHTAAGHLVRYFGKPCQRTRSVIAEFAEVTQTGLAMGGLDDGTDVSTFNNIEISAALNRKKSGGQD